MIINLSFNSSGALSMFYVLGGKRTDESMYAVNNADVIDFSHCRF